MDRIYSEPNDENDHTERIRRQRLSSILKAPRSPLKDLGSGNEFTQDYDPEKRRKNSRRVSFADTIKVFQTDFQTNVAEPENTEQATNGRNQVLFNQNEGAEAVQCEITGMDTLLHAPIQTLGQQSEWHENNQTNKNDRTLIFLDENEMDMTASHTAVITRNLKSNEEIDKPQKIDIKSFLAGLTSKNEEPEMRKELRFFSDPTEANYACPSLQQKPDFEPIKKIDFNEFLRRLKSNRTSVSPTFEGPDKENLFFVPTQVPESSSSSPVKSVYSHAQENTSNMTRIFRGQDDGMDITNCHVSSINTMFPNTCEIVSKQLGCGEVTMACGDMGVTASQTVNMSVPKINTFNIEKQSQNIRMDLSSNFVADHSRLNRKSDHQLIVPQGSQQRVEKKTVSVEVEEDITRSHTILTDNHNVSETSDQGFRSRTVVPGCVSSEPVFHGNKTVVFSSGNDMEMTGNCTIDNCNETSRGTGRCFYEAFQKPGNSCSLLMEKTVSRNDDMDITKCQISDNHILKQCKNNSRTISFVLDNGHEKAIQSHRAASETLGPDSSANPGSWTSLDTFQHRAGTSLIVSLPSDKTIVFSGEDMDLTTSHIAKDAEVGIGSHLPPMSADMKFKPKIFGSKSSSSNLNDQEEMGISKCHALVIDNQNTEIAASQKQIQPKTISEENWDKEVNEAVSFVILDKENALSGMGDHMDIKRSNPKTMIFSSQEQEMEVPKSPTIASNTCVLKLLQRQNCEISQQLRQSLVNPSLACTNDNTVFPDDQSMDITRNHTAALNFPPILAAQEYECTHTQNSIISEPQQLQNKTLFFSGGSDIDITRSQTAAIECGSLRKNSDQKNGTPGNNQIPDRGTARFSFTSSDDVLPSGIEENVPFGKTAGIHNFGKTAGIHIDSKNSESQQQSHTMAELNKVPPNTANFEKLSSTHKASLSSKQDFTKSHAIENDDMHLRCAEQPSLARISMPDTKDSQRASLSEKSDVFFSAENVDLTGSCVVNVLDTVLMKRKDNTLLPKKKDFISCRTTTAADSLQQQKGGECPLMHTKMLSRNGLISLSFSNEKTVIFSADDDGMEMTKSHTMTTDNKIYLQGQSSNNIRPLTAADKTVVFTCNDEMEITRPNTIVIDKPLEKTLSETVAAQGKETGRKNPIGSSSEKTVVFSLGDENHMDMTECHTVIKEKNYLRGESSNNVIPLIPADKTVVFTCSDDMEITRPNTIVIDKPLEKILSQTVAAQSKETGRKNPIGSSSEKTVVFSLGDENHVDMTECHTVVKEKNYLRGESSNNVIPLIPADKTVVFTCNDDMEITRPNTIVIDKPLEKILSQTVAVQSKETGRKNPIGSSSEKTVVFSLGDENHMDMTECHTVIKEKNYLRGESSNNVIPLIPADKTVVFTCNDDMEITRPNTIVIDKPLEKILSQTVAAQSKETGRKNPTGSSSEKTVVFSLGDENHMDMTECHTVVKEKNYLRGESSDNVIPLIPADKTVVFTCNDDMEITRLNTVVTDNPTQKVAPQTVPEQGKGDRGKHVIGSSTEKAVVFSWGGENDMEITESHTAAISHEILSQDERAPHAQSAFHGDEMVLAFNQDDMEITESHNTDTTMKKGMHVDRLKLDMGVGQEAFSNSKTVVFAVGDDMETTKIHKVFLDYEVAQQSIQTIHAGPVFPANKTIVFTYDQEKMDITASHTVAINSNNLKGSEDQEVSSKSHKQQNLCRTSAPTCGERTHFLHTEDLGKGCHSDVGDNHGPDFPALSVLMFPGKKEEREILKIHSDATEKSIVTISLSIPEVTSDSVQEPQNVNNFSKGSSSSVYCQDLKNQVKPKSKRVSFKLPENQIESSTYNVESQRKDVAENSLLGGEGENGNNVSQVLDWNLKSHLSKETSNSLNTGAVNMLDTGNIDLKNNPGTLTSYRHEHGPAELDTDGTDVISHKETKENEGVSAEWEELKRDTEKTKQFSQDSDMPAEKVDPKLLPELSEIVNICSKIKNLKRKYDVFPVSQMAATSNLSENFPKLPTQPEELLSLGKDVEKGSTNALYNKEEENVYFENGDGPTDPLSDTTHTGKLQVRNLPLGIFPPKLPNKRNSTASSVKDLNAKSVDGVEIQGSEINIVTSNTSDNVCSTGRQNLSPSQYIDEELLPTCPEELDSVEFVSYEPLDGAYNEMNKKAIFQNKSNQLEEQETCKNQKRAWEQEKEELHKEKKMKRIESWDGDTTKEQQATASIILSHSQAETHEGENPSSVSAKSLERTNSSNSSCLDSLKTDTDFSMQQSSQKERQLLMDSICEENLFEKLQDGVITVGEFLTLLQVHVLIQKPRQSHLPANHAVDTAPTPEDLIFSEYIYRPKLQIYEEDCQVLAQMIEDLKLCAGVQDKLLVDVNKSLWEVMRTCSDNELKNFGTELNKMKSCFTKKSKVLGHKGKVKLYDNLVQNTQIQWEKLQSRIAKVDEFLREMDSCLCALGTVTELEEWEADVSDPVADWESKVRNLEKELENLRAQEEELQRDLINLEIQKQQGFSEINCLQKKASDCEELLDRYNFTEWEMSEWSDQQAVFIFLYGSVELTIKFEPPMDGAVFNDNPCRKIIDISFESLLDEEKAPFSSCLVQRLIFQFIESQGFWQTKCTTMHHLPQMLHEISLVVNRCRLLGEEIEFLNRWGGKFNLLKTEVDNTKVKLSFSTSTAFAKFEVTLSLSANYPSAPLPFTVKKQIGRLGHDEISAVLSNVPLGTNYLRRMVKMIHQNLLQGSLIIH